MSDLDLDHPTRGIDWRRTPGPQIRSRLVVLADAVKAAEADRDAYRAALEAIVRYAREPHSELGVGHGVDLCIGCLIEGTANAVLAGDHDQGAQQ